MIIKNVVIFGGGTGLSQILSGLKLFPVNITAVVSVSDNGASTGRLRKDLHIPAVGDISKVILAMANTDKDIINLMNYRFTKFETLGNHSIKNLLLSALPLGNHSIKNLLLSALLDIKGNFNDSIPILMKLLDINGTVLPLTEDNANLVGYTISNKKIIGEEQITKCSDKIIKVTYDKDIKVNKKVLKAIKESDLIIFSAGSLLTSIIPHLICKDILKEINNSKAKKMYICNLFTQPGETDNYTVSNHIEELEKYLGKSTIDVVIANDNGLDKIVVEKYRTKEQKDPVKLDIENLNKMNIQVIMDKLTTIENGMYRHNSLKTGYLIFSYLMQNN